LELIRWEMGSACNEAEHDATFAIEVQDERDNFALAEALLLGIITRGSQGVLCKSWGINSSGKGVDKKA